MWPPEMERFKDKASKDHGREGVVAELHRADGAVEYDVLNTKLWPKGDGAAEICQNPAGSCTRSSALAVGSVLGWDGQDPAVPRGTSNLGAGTWHEGCSCHGMANTAKQDNTH